MTRSEPKTIRELRQARGWSQPDLAERLGVRPNTVATWERGMFVPVYRNQRRLAKVFGVSVEDLALGPAEPAPQERP